MITINNKKIKSITLSGMLLGVLIVCAQITLPLPMIPLTLQTLAVGLIASLLPVKDGLKVILAYLILGSVGLPVFAGFKSGLATLFGPTGGYLIGFLAYIILTANLLKMPVSFKKLLYANLFGASVQLILGATWMMYILNLSLKNAFLTGVVAFILPALIKVLLVCVIAFKLRLMYNKN